jgi:hypothetical protein
MTLRQFVAEAAHGASVNVFQFGRTPTDFAVHAHTRPCRGIYAIENLADALPMHEDGAAACWVLSQTRVPRWLYGSGPDGAQITYAGWLLGTRGTGIAFHAHRDAINANVQGDKVWAIESKTSQRPPPGPARSGVLALLRAHTASSHLASSLLEQLTKSDKKAVLPPPTPKANSNIHGHAAPPPPPPPPPPLEVDPEKVLVCVQRAGEVVYIPSMAQHAVVAVSEQTSGVQFQFERTHWGDHGIRTFLESILESVASSLPANASASYT